jgi:alpha-glucosidase
MGGGKKVKIVQVNKHCLWLRYGHPVATESLAFDTHNTEELQTVPSLPVEIETKENKLRISYVMNENTKVLGLGENVRGMNKRGGLYESYCTDDPIHTPNKKSLYGAHNFLLLSGEATFGLFIDYPGKITYDIGYTVHDEMHITVNDVHADLYLFQHGTLKELALSFRSLMGNSYAAPKWAFGYQQSRWSYRTKEEVDQILRGFEVNDIPCDTIYLDIDYMDNFKDFTVDEHKFPKFEEYVRKLKNRGIRLIPIIDAGVKIEQGYEVYEEGVKNQYFCLNSQQEPFVAAVWPGKVHFPDFLNPQVRHWFGLKYKKLVDMGIEGFWNDMNEPSIFYTEDRLQHTIDMAKNSEGENLDIHSFFGLTNAFQSLFNHPDDHQKFYHQMEGMLINHKSVHNLYGYNMTRSAAEGLKEIDPDRRFLLFSRASTVGQGRYAGIWTGDNHSWWEHILLSLQMMPAINQCGILYTGADTGGFSGDANGQLLVRWSQFSLFTPLFRNHAALNTRAQEPFAFDAKITRIMRNIINLRYTLIPYLYSEYMKAVIHHHVYFMPLCFEYEDVFSSEIEDQLLVGESLMIAPVYQENAKGRYVYVPEDMLMWKAVTDKIETTEIVKKGIHYVALTLEETPIFIRKNSLLILSKPAMNVDSMDLAELTVLGYVTDEAKYVYYDDDGVTRNYEKGNYSETVIRVVNQNNQFTVTINNRGNNTLRKLHLILIGPDGRREEQELVIDQ